MSDYLICCFHANRNSSHQPTNKKFAIRNIDKTMIGLPTNFQHCAHIGCSDIVATNLPSSVNTTFNNPGFIDVHNYQLSNNNSAKAKNNNVTIGSNGQPFVTHMKLIDLKTA